VKDDAKMEETIESIRNKGVLVPILVRTRAGGGYELISGHRRTYACRKLGIKAIPALIREMDDDEAWHDVQLWSGFGSAPSLEDTSDEYYREYSDAFNKQCIDSITQYD
jgi:hypothetical protein